MPIQTLSKRTTSPALLVVMSTVLLSVFRNNMVSSASFVHHTVPTFSSVRSSSSSSRSARKDDPTWFEERDIVSNTRSDEVTYLGKAENALIRPGVVLIAPSHEYNHYLKKAAVFVYAVGLDVYGDRAIRGVVLDHPTVFTMGEMAPGSVRGSLASNLLFQGGDTGNDKVLMMHDAGAVGKGREIGTSGIYEGGLGDATRDVDDGVLEPDRFKFFFNYVEFSDVVLNNMLSQIDGDGDAWISAEIPVDLILDSDLNKSEAWRGLRRQLKEMAEKDGEEEEETEKATEFY